MARQWEPTSTATDNSGTKCDSTTFNAGLDYLECTESGSLTSVAAACTLAADATNTVVVLESDTGVGAETWPAGDWVVRFTNASGTGDLDVIAVHVCRIQAGGTNVGEVASWSGVVDLAVNEVKTITATQSSSNYRSGGSTDHFYIQIVVDNAHTKQARNFSATFNQNIDTPDLATEHALAGTITEQASVTGDLTVVPAASFLLRQQSFRWRKDDGTEATATWLDATNANPTTVYPDVVYRIRFLIQEYGGLAGGSGSAFSLYFNKNSGGWTKAASYLAAIPAQGQLTDNGDTTQQIGAGTFLANNDGQTENDNSWNLPADIPANNETEVEFSFLLYAQQVANGDTIELRVEYADGTDLDSYVNTTSITVTEPAYTRFNVENFRWRDDDGDETNATWLAPTDAAITLVEDTTTRIRLLVKERYDNNVHTSEGAACRIYYDINDGAQTGQITTTSSYVKLVDSQLTDGADTTQQIGSGSYVTDNNGQRESTSTFFMASTLAGYEQEYEFSIQGVGTDLSQSDKVELHFYWRPSPQSLYQPLSETTTPTAYVGTIASCAGTISEQAALTGNLTVVPGGVEHQLAGSITEQSAVTGKITFEHSLAGSVTEQTTLTGDLSHLEMHQLAGGVVEQTTSAGTLSVVAAVAGAVQAQATLTGRLDLDVVLIGTVAAQAAVTGDLTLVGVQQLAGIISEQSSVTGKVTFEHSLAGTVTEQTTVSGDLSLLEMHQLAGTVTEQATLTGDLIFAGEIELTGSISAQATVVGSLILPGAGLYYMRSDGTAANKAAATSDSAASTSMSMSKHNSETFSPGDMIIVSDAGSEPYRGTIMAPPSSGSAGLPITYRASGSPDITMGTLQTGWENHSGNVWKITSFTRYIGEQLWIDGTFGDYKSGGVGELAEDYDWYLDDGADVLYLYSSGGDPDTVYTSPGVEAPWQDRAVNLDRAYIVYDGILFQKASYACMRSTTAPSHVTIRNCTCQWGGNSGIQLSNSGGSYTDILIEDNVCRWNSTVGIQCVYGGYGMRIRRNTCYEQAKFHGTSANVAGIKLYDGQSTPMSGNIIEHNKLYSNGSQDTAHFQGHSGVWFDDVQGTASSPNHIRHNLCYDNWGNGIFIEISSYNWVYGNVCYDNAKNSGLNEFMPCNIAVDSRETYKSEYNRIYNNTCSGGKCGLKLATYTRTSPEVNYNEFKNNIVVGSSLREGYFNFGGDNDGTYGTGNVYSNNCFGGEPLTALNWSGSDYTTYDAWLAATPTSGKSDDNIESDPSFFNSGSDQYWLASNSPCIDAGSDLGTPYNIALHPSSSWPSSVITVNQDSYDSWEVGAYAFPYFNLAGTVAEQAAVTGDLSLLEMLQLAGIIAEQAGFAGDLDLILALAGAIAEQSAAIGDLTVIPATGWAHIFLGVSAANIASVNGVAKANVNAINGVT